ncbi:MAG: metallophosphoesterase [Bacteroidales bacterium]|nr:metallophosphoesterase [Bacteroidales bacterium]
MRLPLPAIFFLIVMSLLVDFYIWTDIRNSKSRKRWKWSEWYAVSSILMWIFLIVTLCLPRRGLDGGVYTVMWMLTTYLSIYIPKIIYCVLSLFGKIPLLFKARRWKWTKPAGFILALICFASVWCGVFFTRTHIRTIDITLTSQRLPESFDGYRIVQISDLHLGTCGENTKFIEKMVDKINALQPDLIVFTGDIVNQKSDEMKPFIAKLSRLKAEDGVYSILGNHDYGDYVDWPSKEAKKANMDLLYKFQAAAGWKLLNNDHVFLTKQYTIPGDSLPTTDSIALIGVENWGDPPFGQYGDLDKAYPSVEGRGVNDDKFKILLTHNPAHWVEVVRTGTNIDLSLSGHTHAMQMSVNGFGRRWSPSKWRYITWGGFYTLDENGYLEDFGNPDEDVMTRELATSSLYVNIGAGEVGIPFRLFSAYPEITLITLKK